MSTLKAQQPSEVEEVVRELSAFAEYSTCTEEADMARRAATLLSSEHAARVEAERNLGDILADTAVERFGLQSRLEEARKALEEMRAIRFGVSGKSLLEVNDWFNERAEAALSSLREGEKG